MPHGYSHHGSVGRLLGNIVVVVLIAWGCFTFGAWLGWTSPPACYLGRSIAVLTTSQLLGGLAILCLVAWAATLFKWHQGLIWALLILFAASWAATEAPALLAGC